MTPEDALQRARLLLAAPGPAPRPIPLSLFLRSTVGIVAALGIGMAGLAMGDPLDVGPIAPRSDIDIRVGRNDHSGRIEIYGTVGARASVRREGNQIVVRLPGQSRPDIGDIRVNLPIGVSAVELKSDSRASELWFKVSDHFDARFGRSDGAVYVQIDPSDQVEATHQAEGKHGPFSINLQDILKAKDAKPAPQVVKPAPKLPAQAVTPEVSLIEGGKEIAFPFTGPVGAAVFRRGDSVWIVFDTEADMHIPVTFKDGAIVQDVQWTRNDGFTALRLKAPAVGSLSVVSEGLVWRVRLGGKAFDSPASEVGIVRDDSSGAPELNVNLAGATRVAWIKDPAVGDRMAVVTARGPVKNLTGARTLVEATLSSTAQGVAVVHMAPDVKVALDGDLVEISRPRGLTLSAIDPNAPGDDDRLDYKNALYPSLMNADWSAAPKEGFLTRYNDLQTAAADEAQLGVGAPTKARLSLARFLVGQGLSFEAQGVLDLLIHESPKAQDDPQVRGLRVVARMLSGRLAETNGDLSSGQLATDPAARLWQAYAETKNAHYADAVADFKAGLKALDQFPAEWRTRLGAAYAFAALQMKDQKTAEAMISYATAQPSAPLVKLAAYLINAEIIEASGDRIRALKVYTAVAKASDEGIATPAMMHMAMLQLALNKTTADKAVAQLDTLRFRWRGDNTEIQIVADMGQIYLSQGRYREALAVLKSGGQSFGNSPQALAIQTSLSQAFRGLFLGGQADGLQPVEALGLFNDYRELTPIGPDGDEMVRRIVRRLVDVDLLDQAAGLLDYQINNRLQGVGKSSVAADLAAIYLMDRQPEKALQTLWSTRTTLLPKPVMAERRILEARALNELNRPDDALSVLGNDTSPDADDIRTDVYWRQQNWAKASSLLEKRLGDRFKSDLPLPQADEARLIRAGVAYSLLKDQASLTRLSGRWLKFADSAGSPDALRVALAPMDGGSVNARDFALSAAATDTFAGWVAGMKKKFRQKDNAAGKITPPAKAA